MNHIQQLASLLTNRAGDWLGQRQSIDEQTQAWIGRTRQEQEKKIPRYSPNLNSFRDLIALSEIIQMREKQRNNIPLRNADHFLVGRVGEGTAVPMPLAVPLYFGKKVIKDPSGASWPDPLGQLKWGMKGALGLEP